MFGPETEWFHTRAGTSAKLEVDGADTQQAHDTGSTSRTSKKTRLGSVLAPLQSLASIKAAVPFLLNQSGSTLFYYLLSSQG